MGKLASTPERIMRTGEQHQRSSTGTHALKASPIQVARRSTAGSAMTTRSRTRSATRYGLKKGGNVFVAQEERFIWQKPPNDYDAFYTLPSALSTKDGTAFGSSTREDWEATYKNKRDSNNPNAGPGQNGYPNDRKLSENPNVPNVRFGYERRLFIDCNKLAPGPKYDLDGVFKHGRDCRIKISFNKDQRKPLSDSTSTDALYAPKMRKGPSITIGTRRKEKKLGLGEFQSPGPIYDLYKYGFGSNLKCGRTGPSYSFAASRAPRFKYD